ncbi:poly(A)-specific ribonuclease PARN isoform X2 [Neodiprion pinetum]|nr:poly(A)-specific ribonuclease PARN-like isoform X2 [Neodiprion pinetum]
MDFLLVQFGLSIFTYDADKKKYIQQSYNFYVFPRPLNRAAPDCRFMCQASSMSFLADRGFDFNKLFNKGIPYLTSAEEEKLGKKLEERQKARDDGLELIPIPDDDRPQIEEICTRINDFYNSEAEELTIDRCNAFIRRIIHQEARMRWPNKLRLEGKTDSSGQWLVVQKMGSKEEEEKKEVERKEKEQNDIKQAVGLSALLRKISDSGKLIVGHNMLLDLCHIVHQFFSTLPESYHEFKSLVHCLFPKLLDTKIMCQSSQFKESIPCSVLNALHETVSKSPYCIPEVDVVPDRSYTSSVEKYHEAGYDAYITGLCFISLSNYLGTLQTPEISVVLPDSPLLNPFINKLLITRLKDFPYIDLTGKDPNPRRDHVFHITFPKEWKLSDISQLFSPFGGIYVSWLTDTTAYVGLNRRDQSSAVNKHNFANQNIRLQKYAEHQALIEGKNHSPAHQGDRKRKLSSSDNITATENTGRKPEVNGEQGQTVDNEGWETASDSPKMLNEDKNDRKDEEEEEEGEETEVRKSNTDAIGDAENSASFLKLPESEVAKKHSLARAKSNPICCSYEAKSLLGEKFDRSNNSWIVAGKRFVKSPGSTPSASPKAKRSPSKKQHARQKPCCGELSSSSNLTGVEKVDKFDKDSVNDDRNNLDKISNDAQTDNNQNFRRRDRNAVSNSECDKVELKKPSIKLLRSGRKRSENITSTRSMLIRIAQIVFVLLLIYVVIKF